MHELLTQHYARVRPLLTTLPHHLTPSAVVNGICPGQVWADDIEAPHTALLATPEGHAILGAQPQGKAREALRTLLLDTIFTHAQREGWWQFLLSYPSGEWEPLLAEVTGATYPEWLPRQYYELTKCAREWRTDFPVEYEMTVINEELFARHELANIQHLRNWAINNFGSIEKFVQHGFGYCVIYGREIASWSLSDCTTGTRAEVGIHTDEKHRRRGLATRVVAATGETAFSKGFTHIGWHCDRSNVASAKTALAVGFDYICDYRDLHLWFNDGDACIAKGNTAFLEEHYADAAAWFDRALAQPDVSSSRILSSRQGRARFNNKAAYAHIKIGEYEMAEKYLKNALDNSSDGW